MSDIALRRLLHNHGNIATEGSPKPGLCPTLISNDFKGTGTINTTINKYIYNDHSDASGMKLKQYVKE